MKIVQIGRWCLFLGFIFGFAETWWFGWNLIPQMSAESICDLISAAMMVIGFLVGYRFEKREDITSLYQQLAEAAEENELLRKQNEILYADATPVTIAALSSLAGEE